jgi:exopolyphosphatase/guanosine-5'-triphosphate,3'-diphosphate pyrophosphatase
MVRGAEDSSGMIPVCNAGADLLWPRFVELARAVKKLRAQHQQGDAGESLEQAVHKVRVSARRVGVALAAMRDCCPEEDWTRARKLVRRLRRGAGVMRDADVHTALIAALRGHEQAASGDVVEYVLDRISQDRARGEERVWGLIENSYAKRLRRAGSAIVESLADCREETLDDLAWAELSQLGADVLRLGGERIEEPSPLHELRLAIKRLRYTMEVFGPCVPESERAAILPLLEEAQKQAGEVNDVLVLVQRLDGYVRELEGSSDPDPSLISALIELRDRYEGVGARRCERFATWWRGLNIDDVLGPMADRRPMVRPEAEGEILIETEPVAREVVVEAAPVAAPAPVVPANGNGLAPATSQRNLWLSGRRVAVIDIGSNSIRLLAVELIDERSWRSLGEERAMTRLAHAMDDGLLSAEAMARSVEAIGRFKAIAEKLGVTTIRAFATAAVREAANKADFISLVQDRTGLKLELVTALDEGKLTHRSVARVFDLSQGTAAVVDIGGGSMEVVFSCNGVITENDSMSLGAVRVTEAFGGADNCARGRYKEMRSWIDRQIGSHVRRHDMPPTTLVGCGGTFTTLLTLAAASRGVLIDRSSTALLSLGPVGRTQLKALLKELRGMTLEQRLRVPGLPSDRADIIIAGLTAIDRLMKFLGATQVQVHPGGFREGLLLRMIDQEIAEKARSGVAPTDAELLGAARNVAVRSGYEKAHSEQVARLALSIFDQFREESNLIPGLGGLKHERSLLEAAAVLHDVGMIVEYRRHHKHSQTIIRHADLHGWTPAQVELVATIARYHRRAIPTMEHSEYEALSEAERAVVRRLAAILRVADGLDRSHSQSVEGVRVRFGKGSIVLEVRAEVEPTTDLKAAAKKSDLLCAVTGVNVEFGLEATPGKARPPARAAKPALAGDA